MKRIRTHVNPLSIFHRFEKIDSSSLFKEYDETIDVEIGFGKGVFLRQWASNHPTHLVCGVEVRKPMVTQLELKTKDNLDNVKLFHGNGQYLLEDYFQDKSIDRLFIFHPDPWIKKRHHKRRVLSPLFLDIVAQKLKNTGKLYVATDVDFLWEDIKETLDDHPKFNESFDQKFWDNDYKSHWSTFSEQDNRKSFRGVLSL